MHKVDIQDHQSVGSSVPRGSVPRWTGPFGDERAYRIDEPNRQLRGGLGIVFEAVICSDRHGPELAGTHVGLKQLTGIDDYRWHRLEERSPRLTAVEHPNVSRHLGVFNGPRARRDGSKPDEDDDPQRYIVHTWVAGQPLAEAVDADVGTIIRWLHQIAGGLDALHGHEDGPFAHRDLHPRNIIITPGGDAVLIDFDTVFAGGAWTTTTLPQGSWFAARPDSPMPPSVADRMALAKVALHALAGDGDGALDDHKVLQSAAARLRAHGVRRERAVALLERAMAGRGPETCEGLVTQLEAVIGRRSKLGSRGRRAGVATAERSPHQPTGRRRAGRGLALLIVVALVAAGGAFAATRPDGKHTSESRSPDVPAGVGAAPADNTTPTSAPPATTPSVAGSSPVSVAPNRSPSMTTAVPAGSDDRAVTPSQPAPVTTAPLPCPVINSGFIPREYYNNTSYTITVVDVDAFCQETVVPLPLRPGVPQSTSGPAGIVRFRDPSGVLLREVLPTDPVTKIVFG